MTWIGNGRLMYKYVSIFDCSQGVYELMPFHIHTYCFTHGAHWKT